MPLSKNILKVGKVGWMVRTKAQFGGSAEDVLFLIPGWPFSSSSSGFTLSLNLILQYSWESVKHFLILHCPATKLEGSHWRVLIYLSVSWTSEGPWPGCESWLWHLYLCDLGNCCESQFPDVWNGHGNFKHDRTVKWNTWNNTYARSSTTFKNFTGSLLVVVGLVSLWIYIICLNFKDLWCLKLPDIIIKT